MSTFTKIAWRNISRNRSRSNITISAVAVGLAALIFLKGFVDGADHQMVENYTNLLIGHIEIHKAGFQQNMGLEKSIVNPEEIISVLRRNPDILAYSTRIKDFALVSSPEGSSGILLLGIDPDAEKKVSTLHSRIREGHFIKKGEDNKIVLGKQLAQNLKVDVGDKVVILSQASDGSTAAAAYEVGGTIVTGGEEIDKNLALITLKAAQELLVMPGRASEIAVKTNSLYHIDDIAQALKERISQKKYEILSWKDISPMIYQWIQFDLVFTSLILLIVLIVVASGILNTVLMGVLERIREFGIMLALGTKPSQISSMVAIESLFLGIFGVIIGAAVGVGAIIFFGTHGIDLSVMSHALNSYYIGSVIYTRLDVTSIVIYSVTVLFVSIFISLFPAARASRLSPIEAIRHI